MQTPTIATVKEQIEVYRKTRLHRKQPIPDEIISNLKTLARSMPISKLQRELKLSESIMKRIRESKGSSEVIRLAPVNLVGTAAALTLEVSSPRGETISVRGLSTVLEVAELIRVLREA
jgi:CII-binding regulator of phage lambda lysogenization HflD